MLIKLRVWKKRMIYRNHFDSYSKLIFHKNRIVLNSAHSERPRVRRMVTKTWSERVIVLFGRNYAKTRHPTCVKANASNAASWNRGIPLCKANVRVNAISGFGIWVSETFCSIEGEESYIFVSLVCIYARLEFSMCLFFFKLHFFFWTVHIVFF